MQAPPPLESSVSAQSAIACDAQLTEQLAHALAPVLPGRWSRGTPPPGYEPMQFLHDRGLWLYLRVTEPGPTIGERYFLCQMYCARTVGEVVQSRVIRPGGAPDLTYMTGMLQRWASTGMQARIRAQDEAHAVPDPLPLLVWQDEQGYHGVCRVCRQDLARCYRTQEDTVTAVLPHIGYCQGGPTMQIIVRRLPPDVLALVDAARCARWHIVVSYGQARPRDGAGAYDVSVLLTTRDTARGAMTLYGRWMVEDATKPWDTWTTLRTVLSYTGEQESDRCVASGSDAEAAEYIRANPAASLW